jgi:glycosyltransferase involved in cell wall biosynthesis
VGVGDFTICIGTFGGNEWVKLATERAIPSAEAQGVPVIHRHGETLAQARNEALAMVKSEWVVFLDADDELSPGYVEALGGGTADLRAPAVSYVKHGRPRRAYVPKVAGHTHECSAECLPDGNFLVIGTAVRAALAREVGGFREFPWSEDWDLWLRCWRAGATIEAIPAAVYIAHVNQQSRNRAPDRAFKDKAHWDIHRANFPELYEEAA